jgi:hypothetical protein
MKTIKYIREDVDNIIDCAFAELIDDYFAVNKNFVEYKDSLVVDLFINPESKSEFKISQIQPKVLTVVELMKRRYDAKVTYQTMSKSKREMFPTFPLFKYDKIKRFKVSIKII